MMEKDSLSTQSEEVRGFSGETEKWPLTKPLRVQVAGQTLLHSFLCSANVPSALLGRDLLVKLGVKILCHPEGLIIIFPNGLTTNCSTPVTTTVRGQWVLQADKTVKARCYWLKLTDKTKLQKVITKWEPWLNTLHKFQTPTDPWHCTLLYDTSEDEEYEQSFAEVLGRSTSIKCTKLFVAREGVAAEIILTEEQEGYFEMTETSTPHVTIFMNEGHEAKALGPMVKRMQKAGDWKKTDNEWEHSQEVDGYRLTIDITEEVIYQMVEVRRIVTTQEGDGEGAERLLQEMPESLWSKGAGDVGKWSIEPVLFQIDRTEIVNVRQYKLRPEAVEGIGETIKELEAAEVLRRTVSDWNTPILPVLKKATGKYRMVHDLRLINEKVLTATLPTPNPYTIMSKLTPKHSHFTCIDLANAFFCMPLAEQCQDIFAFSYQGAQYTYNRLPQGFILSPGLFNQALRELLDSCTLHEGTIVIQYVDDLLLAAHSNEVCLQDTRKVLTLLSTAGLKVSKEKIQISRATVHFLGRIIGQTGTALSDDTKQTVLSHPKPLVVKDMMSFLGLIGYSRQYVPNYSERTATLRALAKEVGMKNSRARLNWTQEAEAVFCGLKADLATAAALQTPNYELPFFLDISTTASTTNGVLYQKQHQQRRVLHYLSAPLDKIEQKQPTCARYAAGLAKLIEKSEHIVMGHPLHILTSHSVISFITSSAFTFSAQRQNKLIRILTAPHIIYEHQGVNMAHAGEGEPHECIPRAEAEEQIRPGLSSIPLTKPQLTLFCDGCCFKTDSGKLVASYAIVEQTDKGYEVREQQVLQDRPSAQRAELLALVRALHMARDKTVNIYSDSAYAVGAATSELTGWARVGFVTSSGKPIKHAQEASDLLESIMLPQEVAIIKCAAHTKGKDPVSLGTRQQMSLLKQWQGTNHCK